MCWGFFCLFPLLTLNIIGRRHFLIPTYLQVLSVFRVKDNIYPLAHSYICRLFSWGRGNFSKREWTEAFEGASFEMLFALSCFFLVVVSPFLHWSSRNNPSHGFINHVVLLLKTRRRQLKRVVCIKWFVL